MNDEKRRHLRVLISRLNKERKKQARQIDILCNDFVSAQKDFIKALNTISFAADFYESIAGVTDLNELLCTASRHIQEQIPEANVAFFLRGENNFEMHIFESGEPSDPLIDGIETEEKRIENFFTAELAGNITGSNHVCSINDMLTMGLQCTPSFLEKITAAAVPLSNVSSSSGFILIYRSSRSPLSGDDINFISQVTRGLSRSIEACRAALPSFQPAQV